MVTIIVVAASVPGFFFFFFTACIICHCQKELCRCLIRRTLEIACLSQLYVSFSCPNCMNSVATDYPSR